MFLTSSSGGVSYVALFLILAYSLFSVETILSPKIASYNAPPAASPKNAPPIVVNAAKGPPSNRPNPLNKPEPIALKAALPMGSLNIK